ncbi:MAG: hypothetical protein WD401_01170 [Thermomicrobiaceae bacterium]
MRLWLDFSSKLVTGENFLIRSANSVIQALRDTRIEQARPLESLVPQRTEAVWRRTSPMEGYDTEWVPHRVVRWTSQTVLVEAYPTVPSDCPVEQGTGRRRRTYWVNRRDLERYGVAPVRSRKIAFFTSPNFTDEAVRMVESLMRLGLWFPFAEEDLRQVYIRRASQHHPDAGGCDEKFIQLQDDHARALTALGLPVNAPVT